MVIKGGARAEANKLAAHLLRVDMNERVDVRELLGVCSPDLTAALLEMEAIASAARSRRPFYHASINTAPNELMTDAQKARAIDRLEQELGLTGQPRVVVEHVKAGREHLHVAWSRIDGETLCAIPDSHNYRRHEIVARELEREFEHARVQGAHHERDGVERPARCPSHAETRQAERSGLTPAEAKEQLRELWRSADNGQAFAAALDNAGWALAQGDRRGYVALDPAGEVHAVNKGVTGLTAAQVRERLADLDLEQLPAVDQAREQLRNRQQQPEPAPAPEAEREADEQACLEAMAQEFDSRDYSNQAAPGFEPEKGGVGVAEHVSEATQEPSYEAEIPKPDDFGHGHDEAGDLAHEHESDAEARARADDSVLDASHAVEDLARTDPLGTTRRSGEDAPAGLKSPEDMRREWAELMRGGPAEQAPEASVAWDKANKEPSPDPAAARAAWAERLRGFDTSPNRPQEPSCEAAAPSEGFGGMKIAADGPKATQRPSYATARDPKPGPRPETEAERSPLAQMIATGRERLVAFAERLERSFEAVRRQHSQEAARDRASGAGRHAAPEQHELPDTPQKPRGRLFAWFTRDRGKDRQAEPSAARPREHAGEEPHVTITPAADRPTAKPQQRPSERFAKGFDILAEAEAALAAERARETPQQRVEREQREADRSRTRGDDFERNRYHHSRLLELFHPFHDYRRCDHRRHRL